MPTKQEDILTILDAFAMFGDLGSSDDLMWRTDTEYAPITLFVNCNDLFYWACADCEEVTIENLDVLKQAIADCKEVDAMFGTIWATKLFCCRLRGMRPQNPAYPNPNQNREALWALFDACGPPRDDTGKRPVAKGKEE